jgi:predicted amidophosphoribosyltransferase
MLETPDETCPHCGAALTDWGPQNACAACTLPLVEWLCPACDGLVPPEDWPLCSHCGHDVQDDGQGEDKASQAAAAVAQDDARFAALERRLVQLDGRVSLLQWMVGTTLVLTLGILWALLTR